MLGIFIATPQQIVQEGFTGTYRHVFGGISRDYFPDPVVIAIADELLSMQSASRLIVGEFFYATLNLGDSGKGWGMRAEIFYNQQFLGLEYKEKEIHDKFVKLMMRFTQWMWND